MADSSTLAHAASPRARTFTGPVLLALATVYIVWGSTYFGMRIALQSFPPYLQSGIRFVTAGSLLFIGMRIAGRPWPTAKQWRDGAIVGTMLLAIGNGSVVFAEQSVASSLAAIFVGAGPLAAALWSGLLYRAWPRAIQWVGIVTGFGGILLLSSGAQLASQPLGVLALAASVTFWTLGSVLSQRILKLAPGAMGFATEMLAGGAVMLVVAVLRGEPARAAELWPPSWAATGSLIYLIFAGSLAAFSAYMYLLSKVSSTIAISYCYVNPMIAVLLGTLAGNEALTSREALATVVIVASVILLTRERPRP